MFSSGFVELADGRSWRHCYLLFFCFCFRLPSRSISLWRLHAML